MIDLTPLDVRSKRGDFRKTMRGYDTQEVDVFLELVAERLEALVRENLQLRERVESLDRQVSSQTGREQAVHEALVTAQELRASMQSQAEREARLVVQEAEAEARRRVAESDAEARQRLREAERKLAQAQDALEELERRRLRFLKAFRQLLQRELDVADMEEERPPLDARPVNVDLQLGEPEPARKTRAKGSTEPRPSEAAPEAADAESASGSGTEREVPSLDASVEELHALYEARAAAESESPDGPGNEELFLSLEDDAPRGS